VLTGKGSAPSGLVNAVWSVRAGRRVCLARPDNQRFDTCQLLRQGAELTFSLVLTLRTLSRYCTDCQ